MKILFQNYISRYKIKKFCATNRRKKASCGLMGKFTFKKFEFNVRAVFLEKFSYSLLSFSHL